MNYPENNYDYDEFEEYDELEEIQDDNDQDEFLETRQRRVKYHVKMDQFLNNGILIVGVLLALVLVIAFLL